MRESVGDPQQFLLFSLNEFSQKVLSMNDDRDF